MFGCLGRLGCLIIAAIIAVGGYFTRDLWMPRVLPRSNAPAAVSTNSAWQPVTAPGADRARSAIQSLGARSGPVFVNIAPADLAAFVYQELSRQMPGGANNVQAAVVNDQLFLKADVALSQLKATGALGPLGAMLSDRETLTLGGTMDMVKPGLAQFRVHELKVKELAIPRSAIPKILGQLDKSGVRPEGVAADAIPLPVPNTVADVRIARGKITLYKSTP